MSAQALEELGGVIERYCDLGVIVGAELLVIKNRRTVLHKVCGLRDREDREPMTPHTIFNIRSMTKPVTGAALQILIDEGKVGIDEPVATYLPGFDNEKSRMITVEQVLTHRSGLPLNILKTMTDYPDLVAMGNAVGEQGPQFEPGSKFWYSDAASDVVGAIVQKVSGVPLEVFVRKRLLEPLGMSDSLYTREKNDVLWARTASLYVGGGNTFTRVWSAKGEPFYPFTWGAQSLYTTPMDYAGFLAMWMDGGAVGGRQILSEQAIKRSLTPVSRMSMLGADTPYPTDFSGLETWYGQMAMLFVRKDEHPDSRKAIIFGHSGADGTKGWAWPEEDLMILLFTQSRGQLVTLLFEGHIDRLLFGAARPATSGTADERWKPYLGTYVANHGAYRDFPFEVLVQDGRLALDIPGRFLFEMKDPDASGRWALSDFKPRSLVGSGLAVSFERDEQGVVNSMNFHEGSTVHVLPKGKPGGKPPAAKGLKREEVAKFLGFYRDKANGRDYEMVFYNNALAVRVPGMQTPLEFDPPDSEGYWRLRANPNSRIRFNEDAQGRVVSYTLYTAGMEIVRPRVEK
ncbi:MAG: serine hydrolase domain-containing protein [Acidobacteriota bacterium]|nr:serine hydrolase domain-containing protein [Acidobacteriota bacterium]